MWLVEDLELSDRVVAKIVPHGASEDQLTLLRSECRTARKLVHSNIVPVYDLHRASGVSFITMAYVEGRDIGALRGRPIDEVLPVLIAIADALAYAHAQGVVHRDLKVSNVLVDETGAPRLLDFGISALVGREDDGIQVRGGGSEGYASPQQLAGATPSVTDDIFAFGVLARDLLGGLELPMKLDALLNAAMNREPQHRPQSMPEVKKALESIGSEPEPAATPTKDVKLTPPPRVRRVEPIKTNAPPKVAGRSASTSPAPFDRDAARGGIGSKTVAAFVLLLALAIGVFFFLPRWVEQSGSPLVAENAEPEPGPVEPVEDWQGILEEFLPGIRVKAVFGHPWCEDPMALGTWCSYKAGQLTRFADELARHEGRVFFASADHGEGWRGFIEGAISSGSKAATAVADALST